MIEKKNVKNALKNKKNINSNISVVNIDNNDDDDAGNFSDENLKLLASTVLCCATLFGSLKVKTLKFLPVFFFFFCIFFFFFFFFFFIINYFLC
jgi:hypothetical protein